jgi:hypothetical protein
MSKLRNVLLKFERGGQVSASLLDEAPETCNALVASLPLELTLMHAMWAGEEIFTNDIPIHSELKGENEMNEMKGGEVGLISPLVHRHLPRKDYVPFCIFYGKGRARKGVDETIEVNVCARINDQDLGMLKRIGSRIRTQGTEKVRIEITV